MEWLNESLPALAVVFGLIMAVSSVISAVSNIQAKWGSVRVYFFKRYEKEREAREEKEASQRQHQEMVATIEELSKAVCEIRKLIRESDDIDQMLLRNHLRSATERVLHRGFEYPDEIDDINEMYEIYEKRGKNGGIRSRVERVRTLPIQPRPSDHSGMGD